MNNIGKKIEDTMMFMMELSDHVADGNADLEKANLALSMYRTLFDINSHMSRNLELETLLPIVEDVMKATIGAFHAVVFINGYDTVRLIDGVSVNYALLDELDVDVYKYVSDLSKEPIGGLKRGSIYVQRLNLLNDDRAYLMGYWGVINAVDINRIDYLKILGIQTEISLKSSLLMEHLKALAIHDPLTGIYNRSYFNNIELTTTPIMGEAVVMFDIDNFKSVNDSKGHAYGDKVLKEFASILQHVVDTETHARLCFKYGGEEFVLGCEGGETEAARLANIVRLRFKEQSGYTVSAGVSAIGESCKLANYSKMISLADEAMYIAKQTGKNKVMVATSDMQLFNKAGADLSAALATGFRNFNSIPYLLRLDITNKAVFTRGAYDDYYAILKGTIRRSDTLFVTDSLSTLFIIDTKILFDEIENRLRDALNKKFPQLEYRISSVNDIFKEVLTHSRRVSEIIPYLAEKMGLSSKDTKLLSTAAEWHDVGKLCIDPMIYSKPGKLTDAEFDRIKLHAWLSYSLAKKDATLRYASDWILKHHENFDATGYFGFEGVNLPIEAQIISLVDKFDALTEDRCYRKAYTWREALAILDAESDRFNPELYSVFKETFTTLYSTQKLLEPTDDDREQSDVNTSILYIHDTDASVENDSESSLEPMVEDDFYNPDDDEDDDDADYEDDEDYVEEKEA